MANNSKKPAHIITFYSYKGGVGRSRALANTAYQLAHGGARVLCVDFDLEAPGLISYFARWNRQNEIDVDNQLGIMDLFYSYKEYLSLPSPLKKILNWKELIYSVDITRDSKLFHVDMIGPGRQSEDYGSRVTDFDWRAFYEKWEGGRFIEHLREQFRSSDYDYVLLDSRTGISDIGGICTVQFPTMLVLVFTSSPQSLNGIEIIIDSIRAQHKTLRPDDLLPIIPLPSRIDRKEEKGQYDKWFERVVNGKIGKLLAELRLSESVEALLQRITIEYVPWYTYKDELESDLESFDDVGANAWRFRNLLQLIFSASGLANVESPSRESAESLLNRLMVFENRISFNLENLVDLQLGKLHIAKNEVTYPDDLMKMKGLYRPGELS